MKTRNLLLLALGCGLAIMLAGAVFFFQLTTQDAARPAFGLGESVEVGDMSVTVIGSEESDGRLVVAIEIGGVVDEDPADEFRLIASARPVAVASSDCGRSDEAVRSCEVVFEVGETDGMSRQLFYERGDEQARWVLS